MSTTMPPPTSAPGFTIPAIFQQPRTLLIVQGSYFMLTALWALVDINSFQVVTGPKTDLWLVRTVAALIASIALVLLVGARNARPPLEVPLLAVVSSLSLMLVDVIFVSLRVISAIYLLDAAIEIVLLAWWGYLALAHHPQATEDHLTPSNL